MLESALDDAEIHREEVYVTNAVKHFKWEPRGKRRLHKTPAQAEIAACHDWLEQEIAMAAPRVIVALGATALRLGTTLALIPGGRVESVRRVRMARQLFSF